MSKFQYIKALVIAIYEGGHIRNAYLFGLVDGVLLMIIFILVMGVIKYG